MESKKADKDYVINIDCDQPSTEISGPVNYSIEVNCTNCTYKTDSLPYNVSVSCGLTYTVSIMAFNRCGPVSTNVVMVVNPFPCKEFVRNKAMSIQGGSCTCKLIHTCMYMYYRIARNIGGL